MSKMSDEEYIYFLFLVMLVGLKNMPTASPCRKITFNKKEQPIYSTYGYLFFPLVQTKPLTFYSLSKRRSSVLINPEKIDML